MFRDTKWRSINALFLLIMMISSCAAPAAPAPATDAPAAATPVVENTPPVDIPEQLIIAYAGYPATSLIDRAVFQTLVKPQADGTIGPDLALGWEISEDHTGITFHLNPDAKFSSGEPVNASHVQEAIARVQEFGGSLTESIDTVEVIDDYTLQLVLNRPDLDILSKLAMETFQVQNSEGLGSGPYLVDSGLVFEEDLVLVWNPDREFEEGQPQRLIFIYVPESDVQAALLQAGEIDVATALTPEDARELQPDEPQELWSLLGVDTRIVSFMPNLRAFQELGIDTPKVQEALRFAIDRAMIRETFALDGIIPASIVPFQFPGALEPVSDPIYDPDRARATLEEAGFDFDRMYTLGYLPGQAFSYDGPTNEMLAQAIQSNLNRIGVQAESIPIPASELLGREAPGNMPDFLLLSRRPAYPAPTASLDYLPGGSIANLIGFEDEELTSLGEELRSVTDEGEQDVLLRSIQEILLDRGPYNPILQPPVYIGHNERSGNYVWGAYGKSASSAYRYVKHRLFICPSLNSCQSTCQTDCGGWKCKLCSFCHSSINSC